MLSLRTGTIIAWLTLLGVISIGLASSPAQAESGDTCGATEVVYVRDSVKQLNSDFAINLQKSFEERAHSAGGAHWHELDGQYQAAATPMLPMSDSTDGVLSVAGVYAYESSVTQGVEALTTHLRDRMHTCGDSVFVVVGLGQGAHVIGNTLPKLSDQAQQRIAHVGLLGDPKLHLPEGAGDQPACYGEEFSAYRREVMNCRTAKGAFGARIPYTTSALADKTGLWCDVSDYLCGGTRNPYEQRSDIAYSANVDSVAREAMVAAKKALSAKNRDVSAEQSNQQAVTGVHIAQDEPRVTAKLSLAVYSAKPGQAVTFDASTSRASGEKALSYEWDFDGDGKVDPTATGSVVSHTYPEAYEGDVKLTVRSGSLSDRVTATVKIHDTSSLPAAPRASQLQLEGADDSLVHVRWQADSSDIQAWGIMVNGAPIGRVAADARQVAIEGLDTARHHVIAVAALEHNGELGEFAKVVRESSVPDGADQPAPDQLEQADAAAATERETLRSYTASRQVATLPAPGTPAKVIDDDPVLGQISTSVASHIVADITAQPRDEVSTTEKVIGNVPVVAGVVAIAVSILSTMLYAYYHFRIW